MSKKYNGGSMLDFYNYGESNRMDAAIGGVYKVKVSGKDGNIITIEDDNGLYACVKIAFDEETHTLKLIDAAHDDSIIAEVEMPNAEYISNCRYDSEQNAILFDVKSLYGDDTSTISLDINEFVELYEAGNGIEIGEPNAETKRKPISIKLAEGEGLLQVTESGLSIDDKVITEDELEEAISGKADISYVDEFSADTQFKFAEANEKLNAYARYAANEFAHRVDVYTKPEIDEMFSGASGFVTYDWIEEQGFIDEDELNEALQPYATRQWVDNWTQRKGFITEYDADLRYANLDEFVLFSGETADALNDLDERVTKNSEDISANTEAITDDINALSAQVLTNKDNISRCADEIRQRATIQQLNDARAELQNEIDDLAANKADKTYADAISAAVQSVDAKVDAEKAEREDEDRHLNRRVDELTDRVVSAETTVRSYDVRITANADAIAQEIQDRQDADNALIGREDDPSTGNTIWAAKNKADEIYNYAVSAANTYTDAKYDDLYGQFDELSAKTDTELSKFAKKDYVDRRFNDVKTVLRSEIVTGVESAMTYTDDEIAKLDINIQELDDFVRHPVSGLSVTVNKNSTILNAFTAWDGEGEYTDEGNGIIDVMHREIHEINPEAIEEKIDTLSGAIDTNTAAIEQEKLDREAKDTELEDADIASAELAEGNKIKLTTKGGDVFEIEIETGEGL